MKSTRPGPAFVHNFPRFAAYFLLSAVSLAGLIPSGPAQVSVSVSPSSLTLATMATQAFSATVTGTTNTAVTWQVNGVAGGSAGNGLISTTIPGTSNEALYLAPSSIPTGS